MSMKDNNKTILFEQTPIPKAVMQEAMAAIQAKHLHHPVKIGEALIDNVAGTGVAIVAAKTVRM